MYQSCKFHTDSTIANNHFLLYVLQEHIQVFRWIGICRVYLEGYGRTLSSRSDLHIPRPKRVKQLSGWELSSHRWGLDRDSLLDGGQINRGIIVSRGWEEWGLGRCCLLGLELQFCRMKKFMELP